MASFSVVEVDEQGNARKLGIATLDLAKYADSEAEGEEGAAEERLGSDVKLELLGGKLQVSMRLSSHWVRGTLTHSSLSTVSHFRSLTSLHSSSGTSQLAMKGRALAEHLDRQPSVFVRCFKS